MPLQLTMLCHRTVHPDDLLAIEYDGAQHSMPVGYLGGEEGFQQLQESDRHKDLLAQAAGIFAIRLPFHTLDIHAFLGNALMSFLLEKQL